MTDPNAALIADRFARAVAEHRAGRLDAAEPLYREVLARDPAHAASLHNLGLIALDRGRVQEAVEHVFKALTLDPGDGAAYNTLAIALRRQGRLDKAEVAARAATERAPDIAETHNTLGLILRDRGAMAAARDAFAAAIARKPDFVEALNNLGLALGAEGRRAEAIAAFGAAIAVRPDFAEAHTNLGKTLRAAGESAAAIAAYRAAIAARPDFAPAYYNLGNLLIAEGDSAGGEAALASACALDPDFIDALVNLGNARKERGAQDEAIACYRQALARAPDHAEAHLNLGLALLAQGAFAEGWEEYEWRLKGGDKALVLPDFPMPAWTGGDPAGRTLLLHGEQGFGDTIQFVRYVRPLAAMGARVVLSVPPALVRLLAGLPGVAAAVASGDPLPQADAHLSLMSLPRLFATRLDSLPADGPYLAADPEDAARWRERLAALAGRRVGVAWAGRPEHRHDRRRSLDPALLAPLADVDGVSLVSLQHDRPVPEGLPLAPAMEGVADFADTAAIVANLDLVISVDTAVAHLAGAMGKPVWLLSRFNGDWRWLLDRDDSPWYPTLHLYRQPASRDWRPVVARVAGDLAAWRDARSPDRP